MSNPLIPFVNSALTVATYEQIKEQLGQDEVIFQAMSHVAHERGFAFDLPSGPVEVEGKHNEIVLSLKSEVILARRGLFFDLIDEFHLQLQRANKQVMAERLRGLIDLQIPNHFRIKLNHEGAWVVQWDLKVDNEALEYESGVSLVVYKRDQFQIVPWHVVEYINSGIVLFRRKAYAPALALMTIAVEATLRDLLAARGYSFQPGSSKVDIYEESNAELGVSGNFYTLTCSPTPKDPTSLASSASGNLPVSIQIRRVINERKKRIDLQMKVPDYLLDHLSSDQVKQLGQPKTITGLGDALSIARNTEQLITPKDLPVDLDNVLKAIRNNLLHLSSTSLLTELPRYKTESQTGVYTLADLVKDQVLVSAYVADFPRFVNDQYVRLWKSGGKI